MSRTHGETPRQKGCVARSPLPHGRFGRLFRTLAPPPEYSDDQLQALAESMREAVGGGTGGWGQPDAQDAAGDNPAIPAAFTYFGQFVDHDVTFDATSRLQVRNDPDALVNFRTPRLDLDSVYGSGPVDEPFHYDRNAPGRLLLAPNADGEIDLPRNAQDVALIGDPRNDENILISGLQIVMIKAHNKFAAEVEADASIAADDRFDEARRRLRWHYQWVVVHDFLRRVCGPAVIDSLLDTSAGRAKWKLAHYKPRNDAFMPVEFSGAAYRFGHTQVRSAYLLNDAVGPKPTFVGGDAVGANDDLRGRRRLPVGWAVGWPHFLAIAGSTPQPSRSIDARISPVLFDLPGRDADAPQSLAFLNLKRGQALSLPSGQAVAAKIGAPVLTGAQLGTQLDPTPLWFYILNEAELTPDETGVGGRCLGPVGATIVAEVLLGLLKADPSSYLALDAGWTPTLPGISAADGTFGLADLVEYATT